jgi:hypothetical protein
VKFVLLPLLLLLLAGGGIGAGVAFALKGRHSAGTATTAAPRQARALFGVVASPVLPGVPGEQRCKAWFGTPEVRGG